MLPKTLFGRTLAVIASVSAFYLLFAISVIAYFMLVPVGRQAADDLAALMQHSATGWVQTDTAQRPAYARQLLQHYGLSIDPAQTLQSAGFKPLPYYYFLEDSLSRRQQQAISLQRSQDAQGIDWYWADLDIQDENGQRETVRIGFSSTHIDASPPLVLVLLLLVGGLATLVTGIVLVRHLTTPLENLSRNALRIGQGDEPESIPETGAEELQTLARSFNRMAAQVKELLSNRTTLLAGISHDLRTPLARMQLALEMLPEDTDHSLRDGMKADLEQMNCLIGQFLELSKTLEKGELQDIDLIATLDELVACARRGGADIRWQPPEHNARYQVHSNPLALRRIIVNLLENAVRYGEGQPVDIELLSTTASQNERVEKDSTVDDGKRRKLTTAQPAAHQLCIRIRDQGPGIPAAETEAVFRPFYRLEQSRNSQTGGTGLGLSIARQLAEMYGIRLYLGRREDGQPGTLAEISLSAIRHC